MEEQKELSSGWDPPFRTTKNGIIFKELTEYSLTSWYTGTVGENKKPTAVMESSIMKNIDGLEKLKMIPFLAFSSAEASASQKDRFPARLDVTTLAARAPDDGSYPLETQGLLVCPSNSEAARADKMVLSI